VKGAALAAAVLAAGCARGDPAPAEFAGAGPTAPSAAAVPVSTASAGFDYDGALTQGGWIKGTAPGGTVALTLDGQAVPLDPARRFFVAFDRDAGANATLVARLGDGRTITRALTISPRAWDIERIATPMRPAAIPSAEFLRIRAGELARIAAALAKDTGALGWRQAFVWPARGRISGRFGAQRVYSDGPGSYHSGLDIAGGAGTTFVAPADGVVILAAQAPFTLEGNLVMIDHGAGLNSAFLHASELLVREGETVRQGQPLGRIGMTGRATGPHLHWSLKWREARLDPLLFVPAASAP
jgi:murein DD-endopeptidase MepM/ murein hydrolase activator NlpD